jgi:hypothetical protein
MIDLKVVEMFNTACAELTKVPPYAQDAEGLLSLARNHPKRPVMLENLCSQLYSYEVAFAKKDGPEKMRRRRCEVVAAVAGMFMHGIKLSRYQANLSEIEKIRLRHVNTDRDELAHLIKEVPTHEKKGT